MVSALNHFSSCQFASSRIRAWAWYRILLILAITCATLQASDSRTNLAKYQKVTASGKTSTYLADFAVDGIVSNYHSFRTNNTSSAKWLEVTFPRPLAIASAHLYLGLDNNPVQAPLASFKFQYFNGSTWTDVAGSAVTGNTATERSVIFSAPITTNRIRLFTTDTGSRSIREMALFPPNLLNNIEQGYPIGTDVRLSLSHRRATKASTIRQDAFPKRAVDGYVDDSSRWLCNGTVAGDTLEIDLIDSHIIGSAHLYSGFGSNPVTGTAENFVLDYWDGSSWLPIPGATFTTNLNPSLIIPFTTPVTTNKIRYRTTTASFARIRELLVFPPRDGGYPLGQDVEMAAPPIIDWQKYSDSSYLLRCGITDGRFLGFDNDAVRFSSFTLPREALGWQLLLNHRDGTYRIRHLATGKCLAPQSLNATDHDLVILEDYSGLPHQDWLIQSIDATYFRIVNACTGMALQTRYGSWTAGNPMALRPIDGSNLQRWFTQSPIIHPKKGIAATHQSPFPNSSQTWMENSWEQLNGPSHSWSYSWGRQASDALPFITNNHTFNPMQWSGNLNHGASFAPIDSLRRDFNGNAKPIHLMGYNEPDRTDQSNMSVDSAIELWPRLEALDAPLVSPAPGTTNGSWFQDFTTQAEARGLRIDFTAVHWYAGPNSASLISLLQNVYNTHNRPVWLTEFSVVSWSGTDNWTRGANYNFLAEFLWRAESLPWLRRYSLFQYIEGSGSGTDTATAPRSNTRNADGSITAFGALYAGWDGVTSILNDKAYHLHNRNVYARVQNPGNTSTPSDSVTSISPEISALGTQWYLIPGITANTVRIISRRDGRRLRFFNGTYVGLVSASNFTPQSEWLLVPTESTTSAQDGWFYLEHPQSNTRLQMSSGGTLSTGTITSNSDAFKWRFVVPAIVENTAPVLAEIPALSVNIGAALNFTASATDADLPINTLIYSLVNPPTGATIHPNSGEFSWTPTALQGPSNYQITVRVSDGTLSHERIVSVNVSSPLPSAITDTDGDGLSDLLEYAFLTNSQIPNGNPFRTSAINTNTVSLSFPWRWQAANLSWRVRHGNDLADIAAWPIVSPGTTSTIRNGEIDQITIHPSRSHPTRGFYILEVVVSP
jgi:hypothetical protein